MNTSTLTLCAVSAQTPCWNRHESLGPDILMKIVFILLGSLLLGIGGIGIVVPGLPTTPFMLLAAALFAKASPRLHNWLISHKIFGPLIKDYRENKALPRKIKIIAITMVVIMVNLSVFLFIDKLPVKIVVALSGLIGIIVVLSIPSLEKVKNSSE